MAVNECEQKAALIKSMTGAENSRVKYHKRITGSSHHQDILRENSGSVHSNHLLRAVSAQGTTRLHFI